LPHVGAYAATVMIAMLARGVATRRGIDKDRKAMPLVVGGWGTRGKSGTERLKAGLFQGLGYEVLVKTTGCEAMFIHAMPGVLAHEVFIYRPYDKATIWEQRGVLALGKRFGVRVFLWECMALQPDLVNLLTSQWMRDDYSTITNAYPDHEDVQGPAGYDVAQVISEFIPPNGRLFTTEDQMLPILKEMAKSKRTSVRAISERESMLIGDDVLARFPYHEHPKNIALVSALAQALSVPAAVALAEMADNVVPDLGVLKTYPRVAHAGRTVAFTNGMSANERTGALGNWTRMHFDEHDVDREPARWIITVVNNRADRVARSEVFARFVVQDIGAHKHFLIGTNVSGLVGFMNDALEKHLVAIAPTRDLEGDASARHQLVLTRLRKAFLNLKLADPSVVSVDAELDALHLPKLDPNVVSSLLQPASPDEAFSAGKRAIEAAVPKDYPEEARPFVVDALAKRRIKRAIVAAVDQYLESEPKRVDRIFADAYRALFREQMVPLFDPTLTGDQIIDLIAKSAPPNARIDIMGLQNIKGTGLDFVYRWVSLEAVERALAKAKSDNREEQEVGLRALLVHDDYGLVDSVHALESLSARAGDPAVAAVLTRLAPIIAKKRAALSAKRSKSAGDLVRGFIGKTFDYLDSMRRQAMAREVVDDLTAGRLSHASAAIEMRNVVARAKGAWATKKAT
jgi:poly-gamma-glutamate synthase PgsB/CapB